MKNDESCFEVRPRACGVFSSFPPAALGILAAIKKYQKKTAGLVGFVKVEAPWPRGEERDGGKAGVMRRGTEGWSSELVY